MSDILVFVDQENGQVKKSALEILGKASELSKALGGNVLALVAGASLIGIESQLAEYGAQKVIAVESQDLASYNSLAFSDVMSQAITEFKPSVVLASGSGAAKDFLPRVAARLKAGLATDCTNLTLEANQLKATKPVFSGKAFVTVEFSTPIQMATIRPNSFGAAPKQSGATAELIKKSYTVRTLNPIVQLLKGETSGKVDLTEAEIIVSGGRAMANADNFKILRDLAEPLNATVGASRAAVDSGYATHDMQVGQTGKVVNPKLYIACGISGAIQHLAGMRTSKVIVAINKDPEAPIFQKADYGIVGDLFEVVPALTAELKKH